MRLFTCIILLVFTAIMRPLAVEGQVVAGFTSSTVTACPPVSVYFTNTSTGATSYTWYLDNGGVPLHGTDEGNNYLSSGVYTVTLTAYNGVDSSQNSQIITIYPVPVVNFTVNDTAVCPWAPVTFTSTSTSGGVPGPVNLYWNFGDGVTYTGTSPSVSHSYSSPGPNSVSLTATNADGCSTLYSRRFYVDIFTPPAPVITTDTYYCHPPAAVNFTTSITGTPPYSYLWTFGDFSAPSFSNDPIHTYTASGRYAGVLTVTDGNGCKDTLPYNMHVGDVFANFSFPDTACIYTQVTFNNTTTPGSTSALWNFGNGRTSTSNTSGADTFAVAGLDTVSLTITDSLCTETISHTLYIHPGPTASITQNPAHPCWPATGVIFTGNVPAGASVNWNFGDGTTGSGATVVHNFVNRGFDTIQMFVDDPHTGCKDTITKIDTLYDLIFSLGNFPKLGCGPDTIGFYTITDTYEPPPDTTTLKTYPFAINYTWNFGDGSSSTLAEPTHIYSTAGDYTATFGQVTANGCPEADTFTIYVGYPPVVTFSETPTHVCYGDTIFYTATAIRGPVDIYIWKFGDGPDPGTFVDSPTNRTNYTDSTFYIDAIPGVFSITVTPYYNGCAGTPYVSPDSVYVDSPKAIIIFTDFCPPSTEVKFVDTTSLGDDSHVWIFGDGTTSTAKNPTHTYASNSVYTVKLATYNAHSGCRDTATTSVVFNNRLSFNFSAPDTAVCLNDTVNFTPDVTSGVPVGFAWYVISSTHWVEKTFQARYSRFCDTLGTFNIALIITDPNGCPDTVIKPNYLHVSKPAARFSAPAEGCEPFAATFTDGSRDTAGATPVNFLWSFGDGGTASVGTRTTTHIYSVNGTYPVQEIVTDNVGCKDTSAISTETVYVKPVAAFRVSNRNPCPGAPVTFTNLDPSYINAWSFGDGAHSTTSSVHTYAHPGTYSDTLIVTTLYGCKDTADSVTYINVPTFPVASFFMDDSFTICNFLNVSFTNTTPGANTYYWTFGDGGGHSTATNPFNPYYTPGYDTVTLVATDLYGCKDTAYGHVTLFGYAGGFSYYPDTGCVPLTVHFRATNISRIPNIKWGFGDSPPDSTAYSDTVSHTYLTPGTYLPNLILNNDTTCVSSSVGLITIQALGVPIVPAIAGKDSVCAGDTVQLSDLTNGGVWRSYSSTIATIDSASGILNGVAAGSVVISYAVTNTCGTTDTFTSITVKPLPVPGTITGPSGVCTGLSITLSDTVATGIWVGNDTSVATISNGLVTSMATGTEDIEYIVSNSCQSDTLNHAITVYPLPAPGVITGLPILCEGIPFTVTETLSGGTWGSIAAIASIDSNTGVLTGLNAGTTIVTYTTKPDSNGCINSTTLPITITAPFTFFPTVSSVTCYGYNNGNIAVSITGNIGKLVYKWSTPGSSNFIDSLAPGPYYLLVKDDSTQCAMSDSFTITQPDSLQVTANVTKDTCREGNGSISIAVTGGTENYNYDWSNKAVSKDVSGLLGGPYTLVVTDKNNCQANLSATVEDTCNEIIIHDVITPNGDGINDVWVIEGLADYPNNTVQIFDKWGNLLYEKQDYKNDWGGRSDKGDLVPDGTYFYLVKLNANNATGGKNVFTGAILIKR